MHLHKSPQKKNKAFFSSYIYSYIAGIMTVLIGFSLFSLIDTQYRNSITGLYENIVQEKYTASPGDEIIIQTIEKEIAGIITNTGNTQTHNVSYNLGLSTTRAVQVYKSFCYRKRALCNKIIFKGGGGDMSQRLLYTMVTVQTVEKISNILQQAGKIENTINSITINTSPSERRGYATHNDLVMNIDSSIGLQEYMMVLTHELGHIIDLGIVTGKEREKNRLFTEFGNSVFAVDDPSLIYYSLSWQSEKTRNLYATKEDFCSIYGMSNPFEDFAECFQLYMNHRTYFENIMQESSILEKKYIYISSLVNNISLYDALSLIGNNIIGYRYRDTTKMEAANI